MQSAKYYRRLAAQAQRIALLSTDREVTNLLKKLTVDYNDIAEDLERGLIEIKHPELLPQQEHKGV
jgi:hypothetical protein